MIAIVILTLPRYVKTHQKEEINFAAFVEAIPETLENLDAPIEQASVEEEKDNSKYGDIIKDEEYLKENNIYLKEAAKEDSVSLCFCGDILFDDEYAVMAALIQRGGELSASISEDTLKIMNDADIMVVNNEFPFNEGGTPTPNKQYTFRADYSTAKYLNDMGADVAILANNHVYDFGEQGLLNTLTTVKNAGVIPAGAGQNINEAARPVYFIVNDIKIALVVATDMERLDIPDTKGATENSPGVFRTWNSDMIYSVVETAKQNADFVVVCIHWGTEKEEQPDYWQTVKAPLLAKAGADIIIGDHPHVLQGVYYYDGVPCLYSLGNFWFNGREADTGLFEIEVDKAGLKSFRIYPARQANFSTKLVYDADKSNIINHMRNLSPQALIDDEGYISQK